MVLFIFLVGLAYLSGSLCSAVVVSTIFSLPDPRMEGSKNPGATNVLRLAGKKYAAIVLFADLLKGLLPVVLAQLLGADALTVSFTCLAAVLGHMYPIFFGFKGGKGVATAMGAFLGFDVIMGVMVIATWLLVARFTRYSSLAAIVALILAPFYALLIIGRLEIFPIISFITLFVLYKHRNNLTRLIDGNEPKIQFKRDTLSSEVDAYLAEQAQEKALSEKEKTNKDMP